MDKETRNAIQRSTQRARELLEREISEQLEGTFDIRLDGTISSAPGSHLDDSEILTRDKVVAAVEHFASFGRTRGAAVADYLREAAFTTLNRFVALKMLETRKLVQECVSNGDESAGFKEFGGLASGLTQLPDQGYRLYLESVFDEIGQEVGILFDRRDPSSLIWPRRPALVELLQFLNAPLLADVWGDDETIGWVYQYFNSAEERRQMRDESAAPRNTRELAVRNQFFTPRYVVQFLVDNTLARTWWQMRGGKTKLADQCEYLVVDNAGELERAKKDPRDLRILDPACGSGHFLLYAFDLLLTVYEEAWADEESPRSDATGRTLREDYASLDELQSELPALILSRNLYGVEIDARASQIAALALWLRAQRAYRDFDVPAEKREPIRRSHIVVAEPMPGDPVLVEEFAQELQPPLLRDLFRRMVSEMNLAGELGTLLRVEDAVASSITEAREEYVRQAMETGYLPGLEPEQRQKELDFSEIDDVRFFEEAETLLLNALRRFAGSASGETGIRRWLFADDVVQGIALIELVKWRFDVVLMNPPFGEASESTASLIPKLYRDGRNDIYAAFALRACELLVSDGHVGIISSRAFVTGRDHRDFRRRLLDPTESSLCLFVDLGGAVLDGAMVETAAYVLGPNPTDVGLFLDSRSVANKEAFVGEATTWQTVELDRFRSLPECEFLYVLSDAEIEHLIHGESLEPSIARVTKGLSTGDDFRFVRAVWEIKPHGIGAKWCIFSKGGEYSWFSSSLHLVVKRQNDGAEMAAFAALCDGNVARTRQSSRYYGQPATTWSRRSQKGFSARRLRAGAVFSDKSPVIVPDSEHQAMLPSLPAVLASDEYLRLVESHGKSSYETGALRALPAPARTVIDQDRYWLRAYRHIDEIHRRDETSLLFVRPPERDWSVAREVALAFDAVASGLDESTHKLAAQIQQRGSEAVVSSLEISDFRASLLSWAVGVAFGRFDIRSVIEVGQDCPGLGPFDPLPPYPPGALLGADGRPADTPSPDYPIAWPADGVLVDDPGHPRDLTVAVREVFEVVFGTEADGLWMEAAEHVDPKVPEIRRWLLKTFFSEHIKRYSKSRRKAPIYWQLATPSASYSIWLYAHRIGRDSLYQVLNDFVSPKLRAEERKLQALREETGPNPSSSQRKELAAQESFVSELRVLRDEVARVAPLWSPDLNDGVVIVTAPLWRLVPQFKPWQKELKTHWDALCAGKYDWAQLAMHLWPERVIPKCAEDRSLAIAHDLEEVFWELDADDKWAARHEPTRPIADLVAERTSPAVKDALDSLISV